MGGQRRCQRRVTGRIVDSAYKLAAMEQLRHQLGMEADQVMAIGDGANDAPMVAAAGLGIAYRAKPALIAVADARLDHHGLDALLWAQGIPRAEWIEAKRASTAKQGCGATRAQAAVAAARDANGPACNRTILPTGT